MHALGVGYKVVKGKRTKDICVRFYVHQKLPNSIVPASSRLPKLIDGIPVDVIECPAAEFINSATTCSTVRREKQRPIRAGISAAHQEVLFGTIGAFCRSSNPDDSAQQTFVLSNNHVFGNLNQARPGDALLQPSPGDEELCGPPFAVFHRGIRLVKGPQAANIVDAAIGRVSPRIKFSPEICSIGRVAGLARPRLGLRVHKHGRTTGYTRGEISDPSYNTVVGEYEFSRQLLIDVDTSNWAFAAAGDSGALVLTAGGNFAVGLVFAANPSSGGLGLANPIHEVIDRLDIELL